MKAEILLASLFLIAILTSGCVSDTTTGGATVDEVQCQENWRCSDWSECSGGFSLRSCSDSNSCGTEANRPVQTKPCEVPEEIPETPAVHAEMFVRSLGTVDVQMLKAYVPVMELLGDVAGIEIRFMDDVTHGLNEMQANTGIHCIQKEQNDKLPDYLRCFLRYGNQENYWDRICLEEAGANKEAFDSCVSSTDEEFGLTFEYSESKEIFPPYSLNKDLVESYGVENSPTLVINAEIAKVKANPESIKQAVCSAFETPPEECGTELSSSTSSVGFGPVKY